MSGWVVKLSTSRQVPYFLNPDTRESRWDAPPELSLEKLLALPGASELLDREGKAKEAPGRPGEVRASHLLVKHRDSRRPASWKETTIKRSKEEAIAILNGHQAAISGSADKFGDFAQIHSDCSSHSKQGDLGWFGMGQMQLPFEEATTALDVGQISDIVETESGVHLILRTG